MEGKIVTAAQYQTGMIGSGNVSIKATIGGQVCYVHINTDNTDYHAILAWVADGNTIVEAD